MAATPNPPVAGSPALDESALMPVMKAMVSEMLAGRYPRALEIGEQGLRQFPSNGALHYNLGLTNFNLARYAQAVQHYLKAIQVAPKDPKNFNNLSSALLQGGNPEGALQAADQALRLKPDYHLALLNRANALLILERPEEAMQAYETAISRQPDLKSAVADKSMVDAFSNQGVAFHMTGNFEKALAAFDRALALNPNAADARFNRACSLLLQGDYGRGWEDYESRWERLEMSQDRRRYPVGSQWDGKTPLAGKRILLWAEQGMGDTIQFSRYASAVKALGASVVLEVQPALQGLLSQLPFVDQVIGRGESLPDIDLHCPLLSLPRIFSTRPQTIPALATQLLAPKDRIAHWEKVLGPKEKFRVGVAWSGNPRHTGDRTRSMTVAQLSPLMRLGCELVVVQKNLRADDQKLIASNPAIRDVSESIGDFADNAALLECMDVVVTVDTAIAHLAGSMGKPTLLMLWKYPDWRWGLEGESTPWYESVRMIRQDIRGDWEDVIERVSDQIRLRQSVANPVIITRDGKKLAFTAVVQPARFPKKKKPEEQVPTVDTGALLRESIGLYQAGKPKEAEPIAKRILSYDPNHVDAANLAGVIAAQDSRFDEAEKLFERVGQLRPTFYEAFTNRGNALAQLKRFAEAVECYQRATEINPNRVEAYLNLGSALRKAERIPEAIKAQQKALSIDPKNAIAQMNVGNLLRETGDLEQALIHYDNAIDINPDYAAALSNRAITLADLNRLDEAMRDHEKACELNPDSGEAQFNRSLTLLLLGRFKEGWDAYEWRWKRKDVIEAKIPRSYPQPLWTGEQPVKGKTVFLWGEQGLGDSIQMARATKWLKKKGARVVLEVQRPIAELLSCLEGADQVFGRGDPIPAFDLHCPLLTIPLAFSITDKFPLYEGPYVTAKSELVSKWADRLGARTKLRIGVAWSGNPKHGSDRSRSMRLKDLAPLFALDAEFYCLQKEIRPEDEARAKLQQNLIQYGNELDFPNTAALIENLDVVVSVDTSLAHLSGAQGKPVALMLAQVPDWRWLLDREETPWYGTMRLFRQPKLGDWNSVVNAIAESLLPHMKSPKEPARARRKTARKR